jgi:hypothetical protein
MNLPFIFRVSATEYESPSEKEYDWNRHTERDRVHQCVSTICISVRQERVKRYTRRRSESAAWVGHKQMFSRMMSTFWRIACIRVHLEKVTVDRLAKRFLAFFMEHESSLPCTESPATRQYSEPVHTSHLISLIYSYVKITLPPTPSSPKHPFLQPQFYINFSSLTRVINILHFLSLIW